jgi:UDP-glucuronate 4-epimerase
MKFLVTGGAGFIGSHVCERLMALGHSVWAYDNLNAFYDVALKRQNIRLLQSFDRPFTFIQGDVTDKTAVESVFELCNFDQVIHLAARAGVRQSLAEPAAYIRVNVEGTSNVLQSARTHDVRKVILASSSSVYGSSRRVPFCEEDAGQPISPYAASKLAAEAIGHVYHQLYGMNIAALRFFTVYGPRQRPDLAIYKFAELILRGEPIPVFGDGRSARDYTYVTDIVDGVQAATETEVEFEAFNLGESQTVRLSYLIELLEKSLGMKAIIDRLPAQPGDVPLTCANIGKARARLGYNPRVKIEEGIPKFVEWFVSRSETTDRSPSLAFA